MTKIRTMTGQSNDSQKFLLKPLADPWFVLYKLAKPFFFTTI